MRVKGNLLDPMFERVTGSQAFIDTDHEYIHDGIFYEAAYHVTITTSGIVNLLITTPAAKYVHYRKEFISCSADKLRVQFFEDAAITADGTEIPSFNHSRANGAATVKVYHGPTITTDGTELPGAYIGGGTGAGQARSGSEVGAANEWVLLRDKNYLLRLTNASTGDNIVQINMIWYEETTG